MRYRATHPSDLNAGVVKIVRGSSPTLASLHRPERRVLDRMLRISFFVDTTDVVFVSCLLLAQGSVCTASLNTFDKETFTTLVLGPAGTEPP